MLKNFQAVDTQLLHVVNGSGTSAFDPIMLFLSSHTLWIVLAIVLLIIAAWKKHKRLGLALLLAGLSLSLTDFTAAYLLKPAFGRLRPCHQFEDIRTVSEKCGGQYSFPSNHASNAAAVFVSVAYMYRRRSVVAAAATLAGLTGFSRIYLGVHFPFDVLAGFLYGSLIAALILMCYRKVVERAQLKVPPPYY